uniref:Serine palmitoyltransferase 2 n=1 Tax=Ascaris suum TaxID=6253 RepID=F1KV35_ASCSU
MHEKQVESSWWRSTCEKDVWGDPPWYILALVRLNYLVMVTVAIIAEWFRSHHLIQSPGPQELDKQKDFVPLDDPFVTLYVNNLYRMGSDVVNRPLAGPPSVLMKIKERVTHNYGWSYEFTGRVRDVINMGSYNYLGFSGTESGCIETVTSTLEENGIGICGTRQEFGSTQLHNELDTMVARFLGVEDAVCFPMGFCTNSMNISAFVNKDCLILSDELNHASLVVGSRLSGATIVVFKHNDANDMEQKLLDSVSIKRSQGSSFKKILIIVEGVYSMEGTIVNLPAFIDVKKRRKAYLFLDEAHSIGALGRYGRGVVEYWGCDPNDVDVLMGTLTKSFAAAGGYIAGRKATIEYVKAFSQGACYGGMMSPTLIAQVTHIIKVLTGEDGTNIGFEKRNRLLRNTRYLRNRLKQLGFLVYGHSDSPVVPIITFFASKAVCIGRESLKRGLGVVTVVFPATPWSKSRARLCVSADHTKEQLDLALKVLNDIGELAGSKYGSVDSIGNLVEY